MEAIPIRSEYLTKSYIIITIKQPPSRMALLTPNRRFTNQIGKGDLYDALPIKSDQMRKFIQIVFLTKKSTHSLHTTASQPPAYDIPGQ